MLCTVLLQKRNAYHYTRANLCVSFMLLLGMFCLFLSCTRIKNKLGISEVKMYEKEITIPTYLIGEPDKDPAFYIPTNYQGAQMHVYPYPFLNTLTDKKAEKRYKALILENNFIEICILPELGGRLYYARDKTNGYKFFYHNHVIKPALIGMAGAWISGGIEWNIPHHHRVSTFMPVDYRLVSNPDGSKTIWVGEFEKRHQTKWNVGLTLYPGKSYIETKINLFNTTPYAQSFLIWANTAVHANDNYQVIFPPDVEKAVFHSKVEFTNWPVPNQYYQGIDFTEGQDVSWWKNTASPTSFFAWGSEKDFLGGIDHGKNAGTVLIGDHNICKGKKMWNWGKNDVASLWDQKLTDSDGTYLELMMGAYSDNQPDYSWNYPCFTKSAIMYYYPIRGMTSIKEANKDLAINMQLAGDSILIEACGTSRGKEFIIKLEGKKVLFSKKLRCDPSHPFHAFVPKDPGIAYAECRLSISNEKGTELLAWQPENRKNEAMPAPYTSPASPSSIKTVEELYQAALRLEQFYNPDIDPLPYYLEAIKRDPGNILVNTQLGQWYLKHYAFDKAEQCLRLASGHLTANFTTPKYAEPLYYLGVCLKEQGREKEALDMLYAVCWSAEWLSPASLLIAQIEAKQGNYSQALQHLRTALQANPGNIDAINLQTILIRHQGNLKLACRVAERALTVDPLNQVAINELLKIGKLRTFGKPDHTLLMDYTHIMRNEVTNYLETAEAYAAAGFYYDANDLLKRAVSSNQAMLADDPIIRYHLGFYELLAGDTLAAVGQFKAAAALPILGCFPYGNESSRALQAAIELDNKDAKALYFRGEILCDDQPEQALQLWEQAARLDTSLAVLYRNMAFIQANILNSMPEALRNIERAIRLEPSDANYLLEHDIYLEYTGVFPQKRFDFLNKYKETAWESDVCCGRLLQLSTLLNRPDEAIAVLEKRHFHTREGADFNYHEAWVDAHLLAGIQKRKEGRFAEAIVHFNRIMEFPFNLESSRDARIGLAYYQLALTYKLQGDKAKALENYRKAAEFKVPHAWGTGNSIEVEFFRAMALKELNRNSEATSILNGLLSAGKAKLAADRNTALYSTSVQIRQERKQEEANAWYTIGLGYLGMGHFEQARDMFTKALVNDPAHFGALFINELQPR